MTIPFLEVTTKTRNIIIKASYVILTILLLVSILLAILYNKSSTIEHTSYNETSNVNYNVELAQNEFFNENSSTSDNKYIASLIKNVNMDFKYNLDLDKNSGEYLYKYKIDSQVNVLDKNDKKPIYTNITTLKQSDIFSTKDTKKINIDEPVSINYNDYNTLIKRFVKTYELNDVDSSLVTTLYIKIGKTEDELNNSKDIQVASLEMPLTTKTVGIDITTNSSDKLSDTYFVKNISKKKFLLVFAIIVSVIDILGIIALILFYNSTKTDENIFEDKLSRIKHTYKGYIQKIDSNGLDFKGYKYIYVDSFNDLLEIRDTLQEPILMIENKLACEVQFIIPSQTEIIYIFVLGTDITKKRLTSGTISETSDNNDNSENKINNDEPNNTENNDDSENGVNDDNSETIENDSNNSENESTNNNSEQDKDNN